MSKVLLALLLIPVYGSYASSGCVSDLDHSHDFVAVVKIEGTSDEYANAYKATVQRVIFRKGETKPAFKTNDLSSVEKGFTFTLLKSDLVQKIDEKDEADGVTAKRKTRKIASINTGRCWHDYKLGRYYRLFAKQISGNLFTSDSKWTR